MSDEDDVLAVARERAAAMAGKDEAELRRLLHPTFGWISHKGDWFDLESYLDSNRRGSNRWHGQELRDPAVRVVGDTAVLRCVVVDTVDVGTGQPERFVMPMTQTWARTADGWKCVAGHAGPRMADGGPRLSRDLEHEHDQQPPEAFGCATAASPVEPLPRGSD